MSDTLQNIIIFLAISIIAILGWYMLVQDGQQLLLVNGASTIQADIDLYQQQQRELQQLQIDTSLFGESSFRSLQSVAEPVPQFQLGRTNPFVR